VTRSTAGFRFASLLPRLNGSIIAIKAWGYRGGTLRELGEGVLELEQMDPNLASEFLLGGLTSLDAVVTTPIVDLSPFPETLVRQTSINANYPSGNSVKFRWSSLLPGVTHAIWQVMMVSPSSSAALDPLGLVGFGVVSVSQTDFTIDFASLLEQAEAKVPDVNQGTGPPLTVSFAQIQGLFSGPAAGAKRGPAASLAPALEPDRLYVRVIPMIGWTPVTPVSNLVFVDVEWQAPSAPGVDPQPQVIDAKPSNVTFSRPRPPNSAYTYCVRVVENPYGSSNPHPLAGADSDWIDAPVGDTLCPKMAEPDGDLLSAITTAVSWIGDIYDAIVDAFNTIKGELVSQLAATCDSSPLPLDSSQCTVVAGVAVTAVMSSAGVPPTVPDFDALVEIGKGELVSAIAIAAAESIPQCEQSPDWCKDAAELVLDNLVDKVQSEVSTAAAAAANSGDRYLYLVPGIKVEPEPVGRLIPSVATVTVADPGIPNNGYRGLVRVDGHLPSWTWSGCSGGKEKVNQPLFGHLFAERQVRVEIPPPGGTSQGVAVLDTLAQWFLPESGCTNGYPASHLFLYYGYADKPGAKQTGCLTPHSNCQSWPAGGPITPAQYPYP
jgi:hypothetical protein